MESTHHRHAARRLTISIKKNRSKYQKVEEERANQKQLHSYLRTPKSNSLRYLGTDTFETAKYKHQACNIYNQINLINPTRCAILVSYHWPSVSSVLLWAEPSRAEPTPKREKTSTVMCALYSQLTFIDIQNQPLCSHSFCSCKL